MGLSCGEINQKVDASVDGNWLQRGRSNGNGVMEMFYILIKMVDLHNYKYL